MNAFRLALQEWRRLTRGPRIRVLALISIVLVPSLYGALYLWSNWDPYGKLHKVPIALVDEDRPVTLPDGSTLAAGRRLTQELIRRGTVGWRQVSAARAHAGVGDGDYAFGLTIPADFSAKLASPLSGKPRQATLVFDLNDANGFIINKLSQSIESGIVAAADSVAFSSYTKAALTRQAKDRQAAAQGLPPSGGPLPSSPAQIDAFAKAVGRPLAVRSVNRHPAKLYGRGLAPFLLSIGLWVFGIAAFEVLRPLDAYGLTTRARTATVAFGGLIAALVPALIGAGLLYLIAQFGLGLDAVDLGGALGVMALGTVCFTAITHVLRAAFGTPGALAALALLMIQLTSCGGLYPVQTTPAPFRAAHVVIPMTYLVDALRITLTGGDTGRLWRDVGVLAGWTAFAVAALLLTAAVRRRWTMYHLRPALSD